MAKEITPLIKDIGEGLSSLEIFESLAEEKDGFFLDSAMDKFYLGRYSFMGISPFLVFKSMGRKIEITKDSRTCRAIGNPFDFLKTLISEYKLTHEPNLPPFTGGAVGYFGYDLLSHVEDFSLKSKDDLDIPDCYLCFYDTIIAFDHLKEKSWIFSSGLPENSPSRIKKRAKGRLEELENKIKKKKVSFPGFKNGYTQLISNFSKYGYIKAIEKAKEYIARGDIYQVNLSQRFSAPNFLLPFKVYKRLRHINPAPFASFLNWKGVKIIGASPERFLRISKERVETRPIKGTRPRNKDLAQDRKMAQELWNSEKDRAELIMIVDLERNDLGRVCEYGSVRVSKLMTLEVHPTVYHLVSTIEGKLSRGKDHIDCLKACFPGGSITGAPKIRAMEIIDELEPTRRKIYTGALGYLGFNQETDLNIVIRTMFSVNDRMYFQVGGGIVADSDPEAEYQETLDKAKALIETLQYERVPVSYGYERVC